MTTNQYRQFNKILKIKNKKKREKIPVKFNFTINFEKLFEMPDIDDMFLDSLIQKLPKIETYQELWNISHKFRAFMYRGLIDIKNYYCKYDLKLKIIPNFDYFYFNTSEDFNSFFQWLKHTLIPEYSEYKKKNIYNL